MRELLDTLQGWRAEGAGLGRAVVVRSFGSAPRPEGAVLIVTDDGRLAGSVSGGCVEGAAAEEIARARQAGRARVIRYGISDEQAWDVGLACGGTIDVLIEPLVPDALVAAAAGREGRAVVTPLPLDAPPPEFGPAEPGEGTAPEPVLVLDEAGALVADGDADQRGSRAVPPEVAAAARQGLAEGASRTVVAAGRQWFVEAFAAHPRLVIVGAVQVAMPLVHFARELGYETVVIDGRAAFATPERFPDADRLVVGWPDEVADEIGLGPSDAVAVLTHDVKFDEPAIVAALERGCRYVGAVGSRKTQADRRARLLAAGVSEAALGRLRGPIGLDLGGREPAETALAIMAEVVAQRHGASGGPLLARVPTATGA
jgi:xanthine dehydrogenase accessory factor